MTRRTLTDELRSVLLFHSLEAPEPDDTVTRILADTVGPTGTVGSGDGSPRGTVQPAVADGTSAAGHRWWRPSGQLVAAACILAVIVLAAAGINTARHRRPAQQPASAAAQGQGSQSQASQGSSGGSDRAGAPMLVPRITGSHRAAPATAPSYVGSTLDCSKIPGGHLITGAWDDFRLSTTGEQRYVYEFLCVGADGQRSASEVQLFKMVGAKLQYLMTLLHPTDDEHLDFIIATTDSVRIQFSVNRNPSGGPAGAVESMAWEFSDPNGGKGLGATVAQACLPKDLTATLTSAPRPNAPAWLLALRNRTSTACALEGFVQVGAQRNGATLATAAHTLSGPAGGVTKKPVAPIIVLAPGATASAILEQRPVSTAGSCPNADQLSVTLPNGVSLGQLKATVPACALVVHPLVGNGSGSD